MKLAIIMPAYNVAHHLPDVLAGLRELPSVRSGDWVPVAVDDGSTDETGRVAQEAGAVLLRHGRNLGKGAALATGFAYALSHGFEGVVTMDADGQHEGPAIPLLLEGAERERAQVVVGSRMAEVGRMPWLRIMTNRVTSAFVSRLARQRIPDSQSGFRFIEASVLQKVTLTCQMYDAESELLIKAGREGFRIAAVPIRSIYRGEESHIDPFWDTMRFLRLVWRSLIW